MPINNPSPHKTEELLGNNKSIKGQETRSAKERISKKNRPKARNSINVEKRIEELFTSLFDPANEDEKALQKVEPLTETSEELQSEHPEIEPSSQSQIAEKAHHEIALLKIQFLRDLSRELRQTLDAIASHSEVLACDPISTIAEEQIQELISLQSSGQHLLEIIDDIYDISRIEAEIKEARFENNVDLVEIIHAVISETRDFLKDKPIALHHQIDPELPLVTVDKAKIREVLVNLLGVAAQTTKSGVITIVAGTEPGLGGDKQVVIRVIDTGPGISPEDQALHLQPVSLDDITDKSLPAGTRLRLSICQWLVQQHNGKVSLGSEPGKSYNFYFSLPIKSSENIRLSENKTQRLILSIDPDPKVIDLYRQYLADSACTVIALNSLDQAITVAKGMQPDAITLDISMTSSQVKNGENWEGASGGPIRKKMKINGLQLLKELKTDPATQDIPVIICSPSLTDNEGCKGIADNYLLKPIKKDELIQAIRQIKKPLHYKS